MIRRAAALLAAGALAAAEPSCTLAWDQAALRQALAATPPTSLWHTDAAAEVRRHLDQLAQDARRLVPGLPDAALLWRESRSAALAVDAGGLRWRLDAGAAADQAAAALPRLAPAAQRAGSVLAQGLDDRLAVAAPVLLRFECQPGTLLDRLPGADRVLRPGAPPARMQVELSVRDQRWQARTRLRGGIDLHLRALDQGFVARLPERPATLAVALDPILVGDLLQGLAGGQLDYLTRTLGIAPAQAARCFTGEVALTMTGDRPMPRVLIAARLAAAGDAHGLIEHLGDAFAGRPLALEGARRAWTVPSPAGPVQIALTDDLLLVGNDEQGLAGMLAGAGGPLTVRGEALLALADPATVGGWLALARMLQRPVTLVPSPLPALAAELREGGWALVQSRQADGPAEILRPGVARTLRLPDGGSRTFTTGQDLAGRLAALLAGDPAAILAASGALHADDGRAVLILRTGPESWLMADGSGTALTCLRAAAEEAAAGLPLRWGRPVGDQTALSAPGPLTWDQRCIPVVTVDHLPPYRASVTAAEDGWDLEEGGLPLAGGLAVAAMLRGCLAAEPVRGPAAPAVDQ